MSLSQSQVVIELTLLTFLINPLGKNLLKTWIKHDKKLAKIKHDKISLKLVAKLCNKLEIENVLA